MIDDSFVFKIGAIENQIGQGNQLSDQSHHVNSANLIHYVAARKSCKILDVSTIVSYYLLNFNFSSQPYYFKVWQPPESEIA